MKGTKRILCMVLTAFLTMLTSAGFLSGKTAKAKQIIPQVEFVSAPVTEYTVGDRVQFKIFAPNYTGKVEYRVVLWNDSTKSYGDLWNSANGYPTCYYTKWQPKGNDIFTLGWPIYQPGSYRITVYVKRVGVSANKAYLGGYNCDSFMESVAFNVKPMGPDVRSILPVNDIVVNQGGFPLFPKTVKAIMDDGTERELNVRWGTVDISKMGTYTVEGNVEGTAKKASVRVIVNQGIIMPYSVNANSNSSINVKLSSSINFIPAAGRFSIISPNAASIHIYSVIMAKDQQSFQLVTDYMVSGSWYVLVIDGEEYGFNIPYADSRPPTVSTVAVNAYDRTVTPGTTAYAYVVTNPTDTALYFSSSNSSVAAVDSYTGKITGLSTGVSTITVKASKQGYNTGWATFTVKVLANNQTVYAPEAIPGTGEIQDGTPIVLMTNTQGASIYYTLDGTIPTVSSYRYTEPIIVHSNTIIKAIAVKQDVGTSNVATFVYTLRATGVSTNIWLRDKTFSSTNYYYIDWNGPFEITLDKTAGGRRIIKLHNIYARNISSGTVKNYGDIIFNETGENSSIFTANTWDGSFRLSEYLNINEHSIKLTNNSTVELRLFKQLDDYPEYINDWFE